MFRRMLVCAAITLFLLWKLHSGIAAPNSSAGKASGRTGTMEEMIVSHGTINITLDLDRLRSTRSEKQSPKRSAYRFEVGADSFLTVRVFNSKMLRGPDPGS